MALLDGEALRRPGPAAGGRAGARSHAEITRIIADMTETMWHQVGIGLAAPQVGLPLPHPRDGRRQGRRAGPDQSGHREPQRGGPRGRGLPLAARHLRARSSAASRSRSRRWTRTASPSRFEASGLQARVVQHEMDHLDGVLFIDRLPPGDPGPHQEEDPEGRLPQGDGAPRLRALAGPGCGSCSTARRPSPCPRSRLCSRATRSWPSSPSPTGRRAAAAPDALAGEAARARGRASRCSSRRGCATRAGPSAWPSSAPTSRWSSPSARSCPKAVLDVPRARLDQRPRLAAAALPRRGADRLGHHPRRDGDRHHHLPDGPGHGHRRHAALPRRRRSAPRRRPASCPRGWPRSARGVLLRTLDELDTLPPRPAGPRAGHARAAAQEGRRLAAARRAGARSRQPRARLQPVAGRRADDAGRPPPDLARDRGGRTRRQRARRARSCERSGGDRRHRHRRRPAPARSRFSRRTARRWRGRTSCAARASAPGARVTRARRREPGAQGGPRLAGALRGAAHPGARRAGPRLRRHRARARARPRAPRRARRGALHRDRLRHAALAPPPRLAARAASQPPARQARPLGARAPAPHRVPAPLPRPRAALGRGGRGGEPRAAQVAQARGPPSSSTRCCAPSRARRRRRRLPADARSRRPPCAGRSRTGSPRAGSPATACEEAEALMAALNERPPADDPRQHAPHHPRGPRGARSATRSWPRRDRPRSRPRGSRSSSAARSAAGPPSPQGWCTIQDEASMLIARLLDPQPGELVADACAAPGHQDDPPGRAHGQSRPHHRHRSAGGAAPARDARPPRGSASPSSRPTRAAWPRVSRALEGPLRPRPRGRALLEPGRAPPQPRREVAARRRRTSAASPEKQRGILAAAAALAKPGGRLVYATCSLEPEENEAVVRAFLDEHRRTGAWIRPADFPVAPDARRLRPLPAPRARHRRLHRGAA